jgi:hypothetical protein
VREGEFDGGFEGITELPQAADGGAIEFAYLFTLVL